MNPFIQNLANELGITQSVNGSWIQAIAQHYGITQRINESWEWPIAQYLGANGLINQTVMQTIAINSGATGVVNENWVQAIIPSPAIPIVNDFKNRVIGDAGYFDAEECLIATLEEWLMESQSETIVRLFRDRVIADSGTYESQSCLDSTIKTLITQGVYDKASLIVTPNAYKTSKIYALKPASGAGDLTFSRASVKRRRNSSGVSEQIANNVPPLNYPIGGSCPSWLFEPQRTNGIRNNSMVGAVDGTPGTLPTNWNEASLSLSRQIVGTGMEEGLPYVDIRYFGTASLTNQQLAFEANNVIAASPSQIWTNSVFLRIIAQPAPPTGYQLLIREALNDGTFVASDGINITPTTIFSRFIQTRTNTGGTTQRIQSRLIMTTTVGVAYDFTIRIAAPQMEQGAFATSEIITSGSALTRVRDNFSLANVHSNGFITNVGGTWAINLKNNNLFTPDTAQAQQLSLGNGVVGTSSNNLFIGTSVNGRHRVWKNIAGNLSSIYTTTVSNCMLVIKWNGVTLDVFENGVKVVTAEPFTPTALNTLSTVEVLLPFDIALMALFPLPLSDAECAAILPV